MGDHLCTAQSAAMLKANVDLVVFTQLAYQLAWQQHTRCMACNTRRGTLMCSKVPLGTHFIRKYQTGPRVRRKDAAQNRAALLHAHVGGWGGMQTCHGGQRGR